MLNNTEKLLRAFIEASGFDVEEVIISESMYRDTVIDYKVTKKQADTSMADAWVKSNVDRGSFR